MEGADAELLAAGGDVLSGKHSRVGGGLITVGLDLHAARHADEGLLAGQIRNVHESVVERGEDVGDTAGAGAWGRLKGSCRVAATARRRTRASRNKGMLHEKLL